MTSKQERYYWQLWAAVRRVKPEADRHALHREAGCETASHKDFSNADFDRFKSACLAITQPNNFEAQLDQVQMPVKRWRVAVDFALAALDADPVYALRIAERMGLHNGSAWSMDMRSEADLQKVLIALKQSARRKWPTKDHLLLSVSDFIEEREMPANEATKIVRKALCCPKLPPISSLSFDDLLTGLGALKLSLHSQAPF